MNINSIRGVFEVDPDTGVVLQWDPHRDAVIEPGEFDRASINCFNILDWKKTHDHLLPEDMDILDIGYWYTEATGEQWYEPPKSIGEEYALKKIRAGEYLSLDTSPAL